MCRVGLIPCPRRRDDARPAGWGSFRSSMPCADINELSHYHTHPGKEENERQNVSSDPLRHPPETNSRADHCGGRIKRRARGDPLPAMRAPISAVLLGGGAVWSLAVCDATTRFCESVEPTSLTTSEDGRGSKGEERGGG